MLFRTSSLLLLWLGCSGIVLAGESPVTARRTQDSPLIDGIMEEGEWEGAALFEDFIQLEPSRGSPATERTIGYFLYDDQNLYFAVYCFESSPETITAQLNGRDDDLFQDDSVVIVLDTFHDRRTAYYFATNLLATQLDGRVKNDGQVTEANWDAAWQSAAQRTADGWSAEFAIPLRVLMFQAGENRTWGFNIGRTRRSNLETVFWHGPLENDFRISQYGEITQLTLVRDGAKRWEWIPYVQGRYEQSKNQTGSVGFDFRYTVRPETTANLTVNPDFAIIEADEEFVDLTRFEVQLEEKRLFFLETNERFSQRIQTFYSRRIEQIDFGGKLASRKGPWDFTLLSTQSPNVEDPNSIPGEQPLATANYTVGRAELQFLRSSNVAFQVANRFLKGENRGSLGLDTTINWTPKVNFTGQVIHSHGPYGKGAWAFFARPAYDTRTGRAHFRYTHLGDRFADNTNAIGFINDDNRREADTGFEKTFWLERTIQRLFVRSRNNIYWSQENVIRGYHNIGIVEVELRNRWFFSGTYTNQYRLFEKGFHNDSGEIQVGYNTRAFQSWRLTYQQGRSFDSDLRAVGAQFRHKITPQLSLEYQLSRVWLDPDPDDQATLINVLRVQQNFNRDLFLRVFFQTNSVIDRRNLEIVFVWRHKPPFGSVQFAFQRGRAEFGERSDQQNTFFVKLAHVF